jgi:hypothetical protein
VYERKSIPSMNHEAYERAKLTHVAIRFQGKVYSLPAPNRHHHVISLIVQETDVDHVYGEEQGFLDAKGTFLNRRQALVNAQLHNQLKSGTVIRAERLFSEDV